MQGRSSHRALQLNTIHLNIYNAKEACAYVCYGEKEKPKDHTNQLIGQPEQIEPFSNHLLTIISPLLTPRLSSLGYTIPDAGCLDGGCHPFLIIVRKDNKEINAPELIALTAHLNNIIRTVNKKNMNAFFTESNEDNGIDNAEENASPPVLRL